MGKVADKSVGIQNIEVSIRFPYQIALVQTALRVACCDGRVRVLLCLIYPRAELIERNMQSRFFVVFEGCFGGFDEILSRFFTLHVFKYGFLHEVVRGALLHGSQ